MAFPAIAVGGNWIIDHVKLINELPAEEHLAFIEREAIGTGGGAYNVAAGLRMLDSETMVHGIGVVGGDADGRYILEDLERRGIGCRFMRTAPDAPTSYTDVMTVTGTGRRTFFHQIGANCLLNPADFDFANLDAQWLYLGYLMLLPGLDGLDSGNPAKPMGAQVLRRAREAGMVTVLDVVTTLGPHMREVVLPALPEVDYLIANELECGSLAGIEPRGAGGKLRNEALPQIAEKLLGVGVRRGVVIHAPECGFFMGRGGETAAVDSLRLPDGFVKGTAGAGDAFCSGMLYALMRGWDTERCLQLAVANAAQSLSDPTTTGGLAPVAEVMELYRKYSGS